MELFSSRFDGIQTEHEFVEICFQIADTMDKSHRVDPDFFVKKWESDGFRLQKDGENHRDFHERLDKVFQLAYPTANSCNELKLRFCRIFVQGLRDDKLFHHLKREYFNEIFHNGRMLFILEKIDEWIDNEDFVDSFERERSSNWAGINSIGDTGKFNTNSSMKKGNFSKNRTFSKNNAFSKKEIRGPRQGHEKALAAEIKRLTFGKNVDANGKIVVPFSQIPDSIKKRQGFDIRNFVSDLHEYRQIVEEARRAVQEDFSGDEKSSHNRNIFDNDPTVNCITDMVDDVYIDSEGSEYY